MTPFRLAFLSFFLLIGSLANAYNGDDYNFQQDRMLLAHDCVVVISSFEDKDHITAYSHRGAKLWNSSFHAKILSEPISIKSFSRFSGSFEPIFDPILVGNIDLCILPTKIGSKIGQNNLENRRKILSR